MAEKIRSYRDLVAWQKAMDLAEACYVATGKLPAEERFAMLTQIRRSSSSVPANIAEGHGRGSRKEYVQFLWVAHGSLRELETHVLLCGRVGLFAKTVTEPVLSQCETVGKILSALICGLKRPHPSAPTPDP